MDQSDTIKIMNISLEALAEVLCRHVKELGARFPKDQREGLVVQTISLLYAEDPAGFPDRLAKQLMALPENHAQVEAEMFEFPDGHPGAIVLGNPDLLDKLFPPGIHKMQTPNPPKKTDLL
jgi:hypothetical protein